ncbi:MAG: hypothetical protein MJ104_03420 [Lachnospiraceae bacterium]|nr:hypothetical protein [Lachnospiraceae bacterium]
MKIRKLLTIFTVTAMLLSLTACTTGSTSKSTEGNPKEETSGENTDSDVENNSEEDNATEDNDSENDNATDDEAYVRPVFDSPVVQRLEQVFENHGFVFLSFVEMYSENNSEVYMDRIHNGFCASDENYVDELAHFNGPFMNAYKAGSEDVSQLKLLAWTFDTEEEARNFYNIKINGFLSEIATMDAAEDIMGEAEFDYCHMWTSIWYDTSERNYVTCYSGYGAYIEDTTVVTYNYYAASANNPVESVFNDVTDALGCGNPMDLAEQDYSLITIPDKLY